MIFKKFFLFAFLVFSLAGTIRAQQCGPGCPVCSGSGRSTGAIISPGTVLLNTLYIPKGEDETFVMNMRGGVSSWLDVGLGYTVKAEKMIWSLRVQPIKEVEAGWQPSVIIGTGSVQTGGSDQSLFFLLSKSHEFSEMFSARISAGAASLIPDLNTLYGLAALTLTITERISPFLSYDGISVHSGIAWIPWDWLALSGILIESKEPAISVGVRYQF